MRIVSLVLTLLAAVPALAGEWSEPAEIRHERELCVTYRARVAGDRLVVRVAVNKPWHTFVMDNHERAAEKLEGKRSLGIDAPTEIKISAGLELAGPWRQSEPTDFSKPEYRWFSWGYVGTAWFAAPVRPVGSGSATIEIRGQACTDTTCKNVETTLVLPTGATTEPSSAVNFDSLIPLRKGT